MRLTYLISVFATVITRNGFIVNANANDPLCDGSSVDTCLNGYLCRIGKKNYASMGFPKSAQLFSDELFEEDEYCDCRENNIEPGEEGMTGQTCQTMFQKCPDKTVCFHGASCQKGVGNDYFCDCSTAFYPADKKYLGSYCEFEAEECDYSPKFEKYDLLNTGKWLCANGSCLNPKAISEPALPCVR